MFRPSIQTRQCRSRIGNIPAFSTLASVAHETCAHRALIIRYKTLTCWLTLLLPLAAGLSFFAVATTVGQGDTLARAPVAAEVADLKQQLEKGLRARRPEEFQFVDLVVKMVGNDTLPLALVRSTFLWAKKKAITTRYPFPYFERALRVRAAKQGIKIP